MEDRRSIGLTGDAQRLMDDIMGIDWFNDAQDAARCAMAYAIRSGILPTNAQSVDTRWASGLFDPTGEIVALIDVLFPGTTMPVRAIEGFVNEGIHLLHERLVVRGDTPADLFD